MNQQEQITAFVADLQSIVIRYAKEFDLPVASAIGGLEMVKLWVYEDQTKIAESDPE